MSVAVASGSISRGEKYIVSGTGTITYNSVGYTNGQTFYGTTTTTFSTSGGSPIVYQLLEATQEGIEVITRSDEMVFPETLMGIQLGVETIDSLIVYSDRLEGIQMGIEVFDLGFGQIIKRR